jgi:hypothetical protein
MRRSPHHTGRPDSATRLDGAIDALLEGDAPLMSVGEDLELLATARLLHEALPRFHPRFGFETRLAGRLTGTAVSRVTTESPGHDDEPEPEPARPGAPRRRGLVAGGAIASGLSLVIPLAGAALVAWRRSRPTGGIG